MVERLVDAQIALISARVFVSGAAPGRPLIVGIHGGGFTSSYHDSGPFSLRALANQQGIGVILLDRPGYGRSHFKGGPGEILHANVAALSDAIGKLWLEFGARSSGIYLVGHSIGGAIALMLAAAQWEWPLTAVSVSGIGVTPPVALPREAWEPPAVHADRETYVWSDRAMFKRLFFGPGAATEEALIHMDSASFPFIQEEVHSIYGIWATTALATLNKICAPVQFILAEYDALWQVDDTIVGQVSKALGNTERQDVRIFPSVGHCIDFQDEHRAFHQQIIDFVA